MGEERTSLFLLGADISQDIWGYIYTYIKYQKIKRVVRYSYINLSQWRTINYFIVVVVVVVVLVLNVLDRRKENRKKKALAVRGYM
jgi:membrane protein DedA with SNARE-associated domain